LRNQKARLDYPARRLDNPPPSKKFPKTCCGLEFGRLGDVVPYKMIHDNKEHLGEDKSPRNCIVEFIQDHTLGLGDMNNTRIHCRNALGKAFPRRRRTKSGEGWPREWLELHQRQGRGGGGCRENLGRGGGEGTARVGSPTPPFYTQPPSRPNILAKVCPKYPPPGYSAHGGGYSGLECQRAVPLKFSKTEVLFDEKFELVCIE
jgi:hypothetical protein